MISGRSAFSSSPNNFQSILDAALEAYETIPLPAQLSYSPVTHPPPFYLSSIYVTKISRIVVTSSSLSSRSYAISQSLVVIRYFVSIWHMTRANEDPVTLL